VNRRLRCEYPARSAQAMVTSLRSIERSPTGRTGEAKSTLKPMAGKEARRDQCCNLIIVLAERSPALAEPLYSDQKKLQVPAPSARMSAPGQLAMKNDGPARSAILLISDIAGFVRSLIERSIMFVEGGL
jgi:hypothetical protein